MKNWKIRQVSEKQVRALATAAIFAKTAIIVKSAKNWKIRQVSEKWVRTAPASAAIFSKIVNIVKSAKIWKIVKIL